MDVRSRVPLAIVLGAIAAAVTMVLMQMAISRPHAIASFDYDYNVVDFVRVKRESEVDAIERTLPKPPKVEQKPFLKPTAIANTQVNPEDLTLELPAFDLPTNLTGGPKLGGLSTHTTGVAVGAMAPLVRIQPQYPQRAAMAGIEGEVVVEFTVTPKGTVSDVTIVSAQPPGYFEREAKRAILRWKFKPRIIDGKPEAFLTQQKLVFKLN